MMREVQRDRFSTAGDRTVYIRYVGESATQRPAPALRRTLEPGGVPHGRMQSAELFAS